MGDNAGSFGGVYLDTLKIVFGFTPVDDPLISFYLAFCWFFVGASINSAIGCLVFRRTHNQTWVKGRSKCDKCGKTLSPISLIPVIGYLICGGRCKNCGYDVPIIHPVLEMCHGFIVAKTYFMVDTTHPILILAYHAFFVLLYAYLYYLASRPD